MRAPSDADLRIGLVGAGRWGANYLRALPATPRVRLVGVCDPDPAALASAERAVPEAALLTNIEALLPLVDAVVIATPSASHASLAIACVDAGKHVLVEKPLATDVAAAREVIERATAAGATLLVGHLTLCHPALAKLKALLGAGAIGEVQAIDVTRASTGARHRRDSALWALGPHDIANVLFVTSSSNARVCDAWAEGYDRAGIELELEGGVSACMTWSRCSASAGRRLFIQGSQGSVVFDELTGALHLHRAGAVTELAAGECLPSLLDRQCAEFVRAVLERSKAEPQPALQVVRILAAAQARLDRQAPEQKLSAAV